MKRKDIQESMEYYRDRITPELEKVSNEYEEEFQELVVGLHRDIHNKFSHHKKDNQTVCAISVMHYLLFNQICRIY